MTFRSWSPRNRRAFTVLEVVVAATLTLIIVIAGATVLVTSGWMSIDTTMRSDAGQDAALNMQQIVYDVREAAQVSIPQYYQLRVYFPHEDGGGVYDRFSPDTSQYIEYYRADASGQLASGGGYLYRRPLGGSPVRVCTNVVDFRATLVTTNAVRITLSVDRTNGARRRTVTLNQRVVFMRNAQ